MAAASAAEVAAAAALEDCGVPQAWAAAAAADAACDAAWAAAAAACKALLDQGNPRKGQKKGKPVPVIAVVPVPAEATAPAGPRQRK